MSVTLYEVGLRNLLDLPTGPVARNVTGKAEQVALQARENVRANFRTRTGNLERSIGLFPQESVDGLAFEIGTEGAPYGRVLELGGTDHVIEARAGNVLASEPGNPDPLRAPRFRVFHPGNPPRPWLRPALEAVFNGG
jgi:hypothetical protein